MPRRCLEHGLDQLERPSSAYSFGAMELAIIVAVKLHAPASRARPDPASMAHKECTMLTAWSCSAHKRAVHLVRHVTPAKVDALRLWRHLNVCAVVSCLCTF